MKTSIAWLNSYLDRPVDADEAERLLTDLGFPIDGRETVGGGNDVALEVEITSNRGDCLSHVGQAREVAAASGRTLKAPDCALPHADAGDAIESLTSVANDAPALCPVYTARVIRGVKIGPSPAWLVGRLESVGLRSVNNVVDVTNFVLLELGQPLHAFDMARLSGRRIVVRAAGAGEAFTAIDGSKHTLRADMLVIADADHPVAVAGVMGGLESEVGDSTVDILLESAIFDPLSVRTTSRALKLASDSSYRFERGVDPAGVERASRRAAQLIVGLAGGKLAAGVIRVGEDEPAPRRVSMRVGRCNQLLGIDVPVDQMLAKLGRLGLAPEHDEGTGVIACTVPTFRLDLGREVDLIEEVARLHGLDGVPVQEKIHIIARRMQPAVAARRKLSQALVAHGYHETVTFSFLSPRQAEPFLSAGDAPVTVEHDRRKAEPVLRPSLVPSLLAVRKVNQDVGNTDVRLYETAATWSRRDGVIVECNRVALLRDAADADAALRDLRGTLQELAGHLRGEAEVKFQPAEAPNFTAAAGVMIDGVELGTFGLIARQAQDRFNLQTPVAAAELDLDALLAGYPPQRTVRRLPRYPGIERDLSVVVGQDVPWRDVEAQVRAAEPALLEAVRFITVYRGKPIPTGRKSVSFRMLFRDPDTTLRHEQVDPQVAAVVQRLKSQLGAELRA